MLSLVIWHAFFGLSGLNNDINVLQQSRLFNDPKEGKRHAFFGDMACFLWSFWIDQSFVIYDDDDVSFIPTNEDDVKTYSIFGYTWAFKTWILESFRVTAIRYFDRYNWYPRVAAWSKKKGRFLGHMVIPFFEGNMPVARLTPDDNEARSDWWISSKAYFDGFIGQVDESTF
ncbi:phospholipase-like protein [Tanacetum coccineum]